MVVWISLAKKCLAHVNLGSLRVGLANFLVWLVLLTRGSRLPYTRGSASVELGPEATDTLGDHPAPTTMCGPIAPYQGQGIRPAPVEWRDTC